MTNDRSILQVFEPAMCCSTGVCGPDVDPALVSFASDVKWLKQQGVEVQRFNLGQVPAAFIENPLVYETLNASGLGELPLVVYRGEIVVRCRYPTRDEIAGIVGLSDAKPDMAADSAPSPAARAMIALDMAAAPAPSPATEGRIAAAPAPSPATEGRIAAAPAPFPADEGMIELDITGCCGDGDSDCC